MTEQNEPVRCPVCGSKMLCVDTTFCNRENSLLASKGQHTGDIYWCVKCEENFLDDFIGGSLRSWGY